MDTGKKEKETVTSHNAPVTCADKIWPVPVSGILHCHTSTPGTHPVHNFQIFRIMELSSPDPVTPVTPVTSLTSIRITELIISSPVSFYSKILASCYPLTPAYLVLTHFHVYIALFAPPLLPTHSCVLCSIYKTPFIYVFIISNID